VGGGGEGMGVGGGCGCFVGGASSCGTPSFILVFFSFFISCLVGGHLFFTDLFYHCFYHCFLPLFLSLFLPLFLPLGGCITLGGCAIAREGRGNGGVGGGEVRCRVGVRGGKSA
jgi:hypothetical protein